MKISFFLFFIIFPSLLLADDLGDKLIVKPIGRLLIDGGTFLNQKDTLHGGICITDLRIGLKGKYEHYFFKLDIGFAGNKISAKDLIMGYEVGGHRIQIGQFYEPFSMDMLASTSDMKFHQVAGATYAFSNSRKLGSSYTYNEKSYGFCLALFSNNSLNNINPAFETYSLAGRCVYRPLNVLDKLIHFSLAPSWKKLGTSVTLSSPGVSVIDERPISEVNIANARSQFKIGSDILFLYNKLSAQFEYMYTHVNRSSSYNYRASGLYGLVSWTLLGSSYQYDMVSSCLSRPESESLEVVARYNYLNLNDERSAIFGGRFQDFSLGVNYYLNKYFAAKLSYSYLMPGSNTVNIYNKSFSVIQLRTQFVF